MSHQNTPTKTPSMPSIKQAVPMVTTGWTLSSSKWRSPAMPTPKPRRARAAEIAIRMVGTLRRDFIERASVLILSPIRKTI
jgi:hypothetical protein